jgi:hypothetical protein
MFFLTLFAYWTWKDPGPYKIITNPDQGGPKTYGSYTDPDPQHCGSACYSIEKP